MHPYDGESLDGHDLALDLQLRMEMSREFLHIRFRPASRRASNFVPLFCMPNHVRNTVTVSGRKDLIILLNEAVKTDDKLPFDFNRIVPKPAVVEILCSGGVSFSLQEEHPRRNWYEWCRAHWGTKWNAYDFEEVDIGRFTFHTAWDPPIPVVRTLSWLFPEIEIGLEYDEPGMEIHGFQTFIAGEPRH